MYGIVCGVKSHLGDKNGDDELNHMALIAGMAPGTFSSKSEKGNN